MFCQSSFRLPGAMKSLLILSTFSVSVGKLLSADLLVPICAPNVSLPPPSAPSFPVWDHVVFNQHFQKCGHAGSAWCERCIVGVMIAVAPSTADSWSLNMYQSNPLLTLCFPVDQYLTTLLGMYLMYHYNLINKVKVKLSLCFFN
jgi:hypothetical protein